ncbi:hypothetical protein D3C77_395610 [compost metagenome]
MTHASGQSSSMSLAHSIMTGSSLMALKIPPGPMVSPEHMRIPYFKATWQSMPRYFTVSSAKLRTTKSAPFSTSLRFVEPSTLRGTLFSLTTISASLTILDSFSSSVSTKASVPRFKYLESTICQIDWRPKNKLPAPITTIFGCGTLESIISSPPHGL